MLAGRTYTLLFPWSGLCLPTGESCKQNPTWLSRSWCLPFQNDRQEHLPSACCVLGPVPRCYMHLGIMVTTGSACYYYFFISQMEKLSHRVVMTLPKGCTACRWLVLGFELGTSDPRACVVNHRASRGTWNCLPVSCHGATQTKWCAHKCRGPCEHGEVQGLVSLCSSSFLISLQSSGALGSGYHANLGVSHDLSVLLFPHFRNEGTRCLFPSH